MRNSFTVVNIHSTIVAYGVRAVLKVLVEAILTLSKMLDYHDEQ